MVLLNASPTAPARHSALCTIRVLCALATLCALPSRAQEARLEKEGPLVVVLDPGHGGPYPHEGAHGRRGLVEKEISLQVSLKLKALLEAAGATVLLTRDDDRDVPLAARAQLANENAADLFLSIHCNSMATPAERAVTRGIETYFLSPDPTDAEAKMLAELENGGPGAAPLPKSTDPVSGILDDLALGQARNDSAVLAEFVHRSLVRATGAQSRGVRQAPFLVLAGARMPAALVEIGFISHPQEGRLLAREKYQQRIATALAAAVREFADRVLARRLSAVSIPLAAASLAPAGAAAKTGAAQNPGVSAVAATGSTR